MVTFSQQSPTSAGPPQPVSETRFQGNPWFSRAKSILRVWPARWTVPVAIVWNDIPPTALGWLLGSFLPGTLPNFGMKPFVSHHFMSRIELASFPPF
jgi:hypothetical protein